MQSSGPDDLVFQPDEMVSYLSQFYILMPGDIISMGSPQVSGAAQAPQFLQAGDVVEVRMAEIGSLKNRVAAG